MDDTKIQGANAGLMIADEFADWVAEPEPSPVVGFGVLHEGRTQRMFDYTLGIIRDTATDEGGQVVEFYADGTWAVTG